MPSANQLTDDSPPPLIDATLRIPTYQHLLDGINSTIQIEDLPSMIPSLTPSVGLPDISTSQTPTIYVPTVKIVEKPNPFPTSDAFSFLDNLETLLHTPSQSPVATAASTFLDRVDSLLQESSRSPSTAPSTLLTTLPTYSPVSRIVATLESPSNRPTTHQRSSFPSEFAPSPSKVPSDSSSTDAIPTVIIEQSTSPSIEQSRSAVPTPNPISAPFAPPTEIESTVLPLIETESLAPSRHPSDTPTIVANPRPTEQPTTNSLLISSSDLEAQSMPTVKPITDLGSLTLRPNAAWQIPSADSSVESGLLDHVELPDSLEGKITGNLENDDDGLNEYSPDKEQGTTTTSPTRAQSNEALTTDGVGSRINEARSESDTPSLSPSVSKPISSAPTVLGREQIRRRYRAGVWPPK